MTIWKTPLIRQGFVTLGVVLNLAQFGLVMGFPAILLPQLMAQQERSPDSSITVHDSSLSRIVNIVLIGLLPGTLITPIIMERFGRRCANIISIVIVCIGWFVVVLAKSATALIIARWLQGFSIGISNTVGPIIIGECSSPRNRGAFLTTISLAVSSGIFMTQTELYMSWQIIALASGLLAIANLILVLYCPETPSWLLSKGRIEESERVFIWLRGTEEGEELKAMIEARNKLNGSKVQETLTFKESLRKKMLYWKETLRKKEFYKPIIITIHLYALLEWAGGNVLFAYAVRSVYLIVGKYVGVRFIILCVGIQRLISNYLAITIIQIFKRRNMVHLVIGANIAVMLVTAVYTYMKSKNLLPFDYMAIGIFLIHAHMFILAIATQSLPYVIAGEVFPSEYRGLFSAISILSLFTNLILAVKIRPYFEEIGLHGSYVVYSAILGYCWIVISSILPETKDRTLQDIENEFRGKIEEPVELLPRVHQPLASEMDGTVA